MSRAGSCRLSVDTYTTQEVIEDEINAKYVAHDDFTDVIDTIEEMVNEVKSKLGDISGIDIIDEANEILEKLGYYIY